MKGVKPMLQALIDYREATKLLGWYKHKRAERIAKIQLIAIKEYHEKSNSRRYTELERASFELEFPEFNDYWKIFLILDNEIILIDKAIQMIERDIDILEEKITKDYFVNFCGD